MAPYIAHEEEPDEKAYQLYQEHMHCLEQEEYDRECLEFDGCEWEPEDLEEFMQSCDQCPPTPISYYMEDVPF